MDRLVSEWGYDGLEIAASSVHLDLQRADQDDADVASRLEILDRYGLELFAISNHLAGQASATTRSTSATGPSFATTPG
ncbi:hypothetical protein ACH61_00336 [Rathayibacter tanaceti]|uniref:Xylose isomerase-like TIM barrel n=1 Tax=Rathayibacter tanaceti TaxID=1671680 RepID=A0A162GK77_9MICO|nr:hypothetical protein ACH61_00336 [Rathayibacter tanaceti]